MWFCRRHSVQDSHFQIYKSPTFLLQQDGSFQQSQDNAAVARNQYFSTASWCPQQSSDLRFRDVRMPHTAYPHCILQREINYEQHLGILCGWKTLPSIKLTTKLKNNLNSKPNHEKIVFRWLKRFQRSH